MGKIETFNIRAQLAEASGSPGARNTETMQRIKRILPQVLSYTVSSISDDPEIETLEILDLLTDIQVLADELTQFYNSQNKLKENEINEKKIRRFVL